MYKEATIHPQNISWPTLSCTIKGLLNGIYGLLIKYFEGSNKAI